MNGTLHKKEGGWIVSTLISSGKGVVPDLFDDIPLHPTEVTDDLIEGENVEFTPEFEVTGRDSYLDGYPGLCQYAKLIHPLVDMSPEAISKRKKIILEEKKLAEKTWNDMNNEGTNAEKEYWIHGFCIGLNVK